MYTFNNTTNKPVPSVSERSVCRNEFRWSCAPHQVKKDSRDNKFHILHKTKAKVLSMDVSLMEERNFWRSQLFWINSAELDFSVWNNSKKKSRPSSRYSFQLLFSLRWRITTPQHKNFLCLVELLLPAVYFLRRVEVFPLLLLGLFLWSSKYHFWSVMTTIN